MPDNPVFNTVDEIINAYNNGLKGSFKEPEHYEKFMSELKNPYFGAAAPWLEGSGKGKLSTPYKSVWEFDKDSFKEAQTTSDCVSHSCRNTADITRAVEIHIKKDPESWVARGATEVVYGLRGHCGAGMSCSRAADIVSKIAGHALRIKYGSYDLSVYDGRRGNKWCPNNVPSEITSESKKHCIQTISLIRSIEEARDALANGYGISICSGQGFSSVRDKDGFAKAQGSWSHAMTLGACDDTKNTCDFLVINSWGENWISGPMPAWGPIPKGSFMAKSDVIARMIKGGGTFAYSSFDGFPPQNLPNYGTSDYLFG